MATDEVSGGIGGAVQGAKIGAAVGGPVGAAVGAVLGGIAGIFGGSKKRKARKFAARASAEETRIRTRANAIERRNMLRELYVARGTAVAAGASESGGLQSSTVQGAIGSIGSQGRFNLGTFDLQIQNLRQRDTFLQKAGKYGQQANDINALFGAAQGVSTLYSAYKDGAFSKSKTKPS
jgi:hypothetical protein